MKNGESQRIKVQSNGDDSNGDYNVKKTCSPGDYNMNQAAWELSDLEGTVFGHIEADFSDNEFEPWRVLIVRLMYMSGEVHVCGDIQEALRMVRENRAA
tara:strand:+ start:520 stop:816 length:297 start_codon:yes stop_codon:yes gene_type:complete